MEFDYDLAVIGLGSAGENLAGTMAERGKRVIGFEAGHVGGECPYFACMPSKSLLHDAAAGGRDWQAAVARRDDIVHHRDDSQHARGLLDSGVEIVRSHCRITGKHQIDSEGTSYTARNVVIATGAAPGIPPIEGIEEVDYWVSRDALSSSDLPARMLIVGGGAIGCELSEMYARYGSEVVLLERSDNLVSDGEPEVSALVVAHLEQLGVTVATSTEAQSVSSHGDRVAVKTAGSDYRVDRLLLATGVAPRLADIGLASIGFDHEAVSIGADGRINDSDWLWAAGDVTPQSKWTHGANNQARRLADRFCDQAWREDNPIMPRAFFTSPPFASVGMTLADAQAAEIDAVAGFAPYENVARFTTDELAEGMVAIVVDRTTGEILGSSIFGSRADDLIAIVVALMAGKVPIIEAARLVFAFPTIAQTVEVALREAARCAGYET